ncbi:EVE domain-containing protein [Staphylococcus simulans]|uniref:HNH endonuclease n=1 Tax=Staphylococcus simulans TaxID=1286 RepID=UPI000D026026|nr:EVE domain-containing protein [Staphylococcus simulans]
MSNKYWVIPCNVKSYDVIGAFNKLEVIDWKQSNNMKSARPGDKVFIYASKPYSGIMYMCIIQNVNKSTASMEDKEFMTNTENYGNYGNYMELKLLKSKTQTPITLKELKKYGLKGNIQGPRSLKDELLKFILDSFDNEQNTASEESELENFLYKEGKLIKSYGTRFERDQSLRRKAIEIHGMTCKVCGFNFEEYYGELGKGFIEVHHTKPMYITRKEVSVDPQTDLVPLCPNCHRMIHRKKDRPLEIDELKQLIVSSLNDRCKLI